MLKFHGQLVCNLQSFLSCKDFPAKNPLNICLSCQLQQKKLDHYIILHLIYFLHSFKLYTPCWRNLDFHIHGFCFYFSAQIWEIKTRNPQWAECKAIWLSWGWIKMKEFNIIHIHKNEEASRAMNWLLISRFPAIVFDKWFVTQVGTPCLLFSLLEASKSGKPIPHSWKYPRELGIDCHQKREKQT